MGVYAILCVFRIIYVCRYFVPITFQYFIYLPVLKVSIAAQIAVAKEICNYHGIC